MDAVDVLLAVSGLSILVACLGLLRFGERKNIVYARLHLSGIIDVVCIFLTIIIGYPLIGLVYFFLTPLSAHAIANEHYRTTRKAEGGCK
ncbi:MAG: cation:proton antiporter [Candidatus Altiarchaeota archaeon]